MSNENLQLISSWPPDDELPQTDYFPEDIEPPKKVTKLDSMKHPQVDIDVADIAIAKWWKKRSKRPNGEEKISKCLSPYSNLWNISQSEAGQQYLHEKLQNLLRISKIHEEEALLVAIATCYERLSVFEDAEDYLKKALNIDENPDTQWLLYRVKQCLKIKTLQQTLKQSLLHVHNTQAMPAPVKVERRSCENLSMEDFFRNYAQTSTPVIITGLTLTTKKWTMEHIKELAGMRSVNVKKLCLDSVEWARLENSETTTVASFIDGLTEQEQLAPEHQTYLFDWSLPQYSPELVQEVIIPKYFAGDFLQSSPEGSLYRDSWPSLFVAPAGLRSELHVDAFASNFWMGLLKGKKRWLFFKKEDLPCLYPSYPSSLDPIFEVDLAHPNLNQFPLLALTRPMECVLEEGEVLFVPSGCPHRVENLAESIAISANFVDPSNLLSVLDELRINGLVDQRAACLRKTLLESCEKFLPSQHTLGITDTANHLLSDVESKQKCSDGYQSNPGNQTEINLDKNSPLNKFEQELSKWISDIEHHGHVPWSQFKS